MSIRNAVSAYQESDIRMARDEIHTKSDDLDTARLIGTSVPELFWFRADAWPPPPAVAVAARPQVWAKHLGAADLPRSGYFVAGRRYVYETLNASVASRGSKTQERAVPRDVEKRFPQARAARPETRRRAARAFGRRIQSGGRCRQPYSRAERWKRIRGGDKRRSAHVEKRKAMFHGASCGRGRAEIARRRRARYTARRFIAG